MSDLDPLQIDERLGQAQRGLPDPVMLDRQVARAHEAYLRWLWLLPRDPLCEEAPLEAHRAASSLTTFRDLQQLGDQDPLRSYLERWIFCLGERRINAPFERGLHSLRYHQVVDIQGSEGGSVSRSSMLLRALRGSDAAEFWLNHYLREAEPYAVIVSTLWQRRAEIARRWGGDYREMTGAGFSALQAATAWLDRTEDVFGEYRCNSLAELLDESMARDAVLDWPGHLSWRTLVGWFDGSELCASLNLRSKALPERIAPASFLLGLSRLGEEWSQALAPRDQFFAVAHEPYGLKRHAHAALFALLLCNDSFLKHTLAAPALKVPAARRALHRTLLIESRVRAFKVVLMHSALQGRTAFEESFHNGLGDRFGFSVPRQATGAVFTPKEQDVQRFAGLILASTQSEALTQAHEMDWFRNPRAVDQLRSEAALPPANAVEPAAFERGADCLYAKIAAVLG